MSALHIPLSTYAHNDRVVGVLLRQDDARLLTLAGGRRGVCNALLVKVAMGSCDFAAFASSRASRLTQASTPAGGGGNSRLPEDALWRRASALPKHLSLGVGPRGPGHPGLLP